MKSSVVVVLNDNVFTLTDDYVTVKDDNGTRVFPVPFDNPGDLYVFALGYVRART